MVRTCIIADGWRKVSGHFSSEWKKESRTWYGKKITENYVDNVL